MEHRLPPGSCCAPPPPPPTTGYGTATPGSSPEPTCKARSGRRSLPSSTRSTGSSPPERSSKHATGVARTPAAADLLRVQALLEVVPEPDASRRNARDTVALFPYLPGRVPGTGDPAEPSSRRVRAQRHRLRAPRGGGVLPGMPWLGAGDVDRFQDLDPPQRRRRGWQRRCRDAGHAAIVVPQPTCAYVLKHEAPTFLGTDDARLVAEHTFDISEYLMARHAEAPLDQDFAGPTYERITWHAACHYRAQQIGSKSRDLLALTGARVTVVERCSAIDGTWGLRAANVEMAHRIAAPLMDAVPRADPAELVAGDLLHLEATTRSARGDHEGAGASCAGARPRLRGGRGGLDVRKLTIADIKDLREYEREARRLPRRDHRHEETSPHPRRRPDDPMVFENAATMRFQIQEMARAERMLRDEQIAHEVETYNELVPGTGEALGDAAVHRDRRRSGAALLAAPARRHPRALRPPRRPLRRVVHRAGPGRGATHPLRHHRERPLPHVHAQRRAAARVRGRARPRSSSTIPSTRPTVMTQRRSSETSSSRISPLEPPDPDQPARPGPAAPRAGPRRRRRPRPHRPRRRPARSRRRPRLVQTGCHARAGSPPGTAGSCCPARGWRCATASRASNTPGAHRPPNTAASCRSCSSTPIPTSRTSCTAATGSRSS